MFLVGNPLSNLCPHSLALEQPQPLPLVTTNDYLSPKERLEKAMPCS